jgi:diacylglycerol kinase family enzyme
MKVTVLLNPASGPPEFWQGGAGPQRLQQAFKDANVTADIQIVRGEHLPERARRAAESAVDAVVAGGGDGTLSTVAAALAGTIKPLGVLCLGTWNHFARDLHIPTHPVDAVRVIAAGHTRAVDVGEVNGHVFINNAVIGAYTQVAKEREDMRIRLGGRKWLAPMAAFLAVFRRFPLVRVRVSHGGQSVSSTTPLLFVGNNRYEINLLSVRGRPRLDCGELCMYLVKAKTRFTLFRVALRMLFGRLRQAADFEAHFVPELCVETGKRRLKVAKDGDIIRLRPPLHFRSRPAALHVLVPR